MERLRSMAYPLGLAMDPSKGGLALQEASTHHSLQQLSCDPSFAERAAKYSTFGSSNYGQRSQTYSSIDTGKSREVSNSDSKFSRSSSFSSRLGVNSGESQHSEEKFKAVPSSTSDRWSEDMKPKSDQDLQQSGVIMTCVGVEALEGTKGARESMNDSNDGVVPEKLSGSQQAGAQPGSRASGKRKGSPAEGRGKETPTCAEVSDGKDSKDMDENETTAKRLKSGTGTREGEDMKLKAERSASENSGDSSPRSLKATSKPQEPSKQDYIHVRARRGQATDSHSLAERVRREKISERMKFLQDLVPGCSKVTGKAVMLDEIINYVQSLQRQIEFLSMKLAVVNPRLDFNYDLLSKEMLQSRSPETTLLGPDPLAGYENMQCQGQGPLISSNCNLDFRGVESACDAYLRRSMSVPTSLVSSETFSDHLAQTASLCDGDLQSIVEMGFTPGRQGFTHGMRGSSASLAGKLKVEL